VALRKVHGLLEAGARVTVVAPELHPVLHELVESGSVDWLPRAARDGDLDGANLAFLATSNPTVNARLEAVASRHGILVNRADSSDEGAFHLPAVLRRGDITIGVSTSGRAPAIAQLLRDDIESVLTNERLALLEVLGKAREAAHTGGMTTSSAHWRELMVDDVLLSYVQAGRHDEAVEHILSHLKHAALAQVAR
jgi:precorrin-2 dehydrogenase / sirohydrochlorin ferrochelatase